MKDYRPGYHYRPKENWINDPCGVIRHDGLYHLYHQYNPYGDRWGNMHWKHAVSRDLVNWEERDIALAPDREHGEDQCYTGCGYHLPDGRAAFFYTSIGKDREPEQWLAFPVDETLDRLMQTRENALTIDMHKPGMEVREWRDPCVLPHGNGYLMVLGSHLGEDGGACLLYTSDDGLRFAYHSVLANGEDRDERSWECPNFLQIGGRHVLMYSPYRQPLYIIGRLTDDLRFAAEGRGVVDESGHEGFYAPQTFEGEQGKPLIIGWMTDQPRGRWDGIRGWSGCMSLPREMFIENGVLKMRVIDAVDSLAYDRKTGRLPFAACTAGDQYRLIVDAELDEAGTMTVDLLASPGGEEKTTVCLCGNGRLALDRGQSSIYPTHKGILERRISMPGGRVHLEIYVDHSVIEIAGNGEWISSRVYPSREDAVRLNVCINGGSGVYEFSRMRRCGK